MKATVLFGKPQAEIASLIISRMAVATKTSIVTGFMTEGGIETLLAPIKARPNTVETVVVGAATYPALEALDRLIATGVPMNRLYVHLGHTRPSGTRKKPFVRYHPMLHSKVYFMELPGKQACAFVGSHNVTSFALKGTNGEAGVLLEGATGDPEFAPVRSHIAEARRQAVPYDPSKKESFAWWTREFIDGLKSKIQFPNEWTVARTILIFAEAARQDRPARGDVLYFEIPAGIEQIQSLTTRVHLFLFTSLPANPQEALGRAGTADASYVCTTLGADNEQGNIEVAAKWQVDSSPRPRFIRVPGGRLRPATATGMQQVRAKIDSVTVPQLDYSFERKVDAWDPEFSIDESVASGALRDGEDHATEGAPPVEQANSWKLVRGLKPREVTARESDALALQLATPESGRFFLVSLRHTRRRASEEG